MSRNLAKNLIGGKWLIEARAAAGYLPMAHAVLSAKPEKGASRKSFYMDEDEDQPEHTPDHLNFYVVHADGSRQSYKDSMRSSSTSSVLAVVDMKDPIVKYNESCGPEGTEAKAAQIRQAAADPRVAAIILDIDSPGGSADAVQNPSAAIHEARKKKPVIAYVGNGMAASAAYWIASACDEIYATYATDEIGSIGTYITMVNYEKFIANFYNTDVVQVYATKSTEKNKGYRDAMAEKPNTEYLVQHDLDPFNEHFINTVKGNRPQVKESAYSGRLFLASEAMEAGLIDGMKTLDETIQRAMELANDRAEAEGATTSKAKTGRESTTHTDMFEPKQIKALAGEAPSAEAISEANAYMAKLGVTEASIMSNRDIETLRGASTRVAELEQQLAEASASAGYEAAEGTTLAAHITATKEANTEKVNALNERIATLGGQPEEVVTTTTQATTEKVTTETSAANAAMDEFYKSIDSKLYN